MKFPSTGAERLHAVATGVKAMWKKLDDMENFATVIPHKREGQRNGPSARIPSDPAKLHTVVGDVEFDRLRVAVPVE